MMSITDLVQSSGWKQFMAKVYGFGAAIVILGALFKINHWPGGGAVITAGLIVEALIFIFSAFEPLHEELDWTLVYPELAGISDPDEIENFNKNNYQAGNGASVQSLDSALGSTGLDNEVLAKLGDGFNQLGESAKSLAEISGATVATKEFVTKLQTASASVGELHETYSSSAASIKQSATTLSGAYHETADTIKKSGSEIASSYREIAEILVSGHKNISSGTKEYEEQVTMLGRNLAELNGVYKTQITETSQQMKGSQDLYAGLHEMISNLKSSVDETNQYKEEISKLKQNISSLNNIYGNMLNAMGTPNK